MPNWRHMGQARQPIDLIGRLSLSHLQPGAFIDSVMLPCPSPEPDTHRSPISLGFPTIGQTNDLNRTVRGYELVSGTDGSSENHGLRLMRG